METQIINATEVSVETSKGELRAVASHDEAYPGILLYLGDELYGALEIYEEDGLLRFRGYNDIQDEPIVLETLKEF